MITTTGERISPDNGPSGESDKAILDAALEDMDEGLVWVEGQGWMYPDDVEDD